MTLTVTTCQHCPDGHENPERRPWAVWVTADRDPDGQPTRLHVGKTGGQHVAEADAEWARQKLNAPGDIVQSGAMKGCVRVEGLCPSCGIAALAVGVGGFVTCANLSCREPDAASTLLQA